MPLYEVMMITTISASRNYLANMVRRCWKTVNTGGGVMRSVVNLGIRPLAYRMRAHNKLNVMGRFVRLTIQVSPETLEQLQKRLLVDEEVIRYLTIKHRTVPEIHPKMRIPTLPPITAIETAKSIVRIRKTTPLDYYVARSMLYAGIMSPVDIAGLPRHRYDRAWENTRHHLIFDADGSMPLMPENVAPLISIGCNFTEDELTFVDELRKLEIDQQKASWKRYKEPALKAFGAEVANYMENGLINDFNYADGDRIYDDENDSTDAGVSKSETLETVAEEHEDGDENSQRQS